MAWDDSDEVDEEILEYEVCLAVTPNAALLKALDGTESWFPFSLCSDLEGVEKGDGPDEFTCPRWKAEEAGWA